MKTRRVRPASFAILLFLIIISLLPFYIMFLGAFKSNAALSLIPPDLNPFQNLILKNLIHVLEKSDIFLWLGNSFVISVGVALLTVFIGATAGYSFAKIKFPGSNILFIIVIATMILPRQVMLIPNFIIAKDLNLTNTAIGVILTTVAPSFGIFLCRQFMMSIPKELMESSEIDGCSEVKKFISVIVPLSLPALGTVGLFSFFSAYNDFLWQLIMISDKALQTVPIGIAMFAQKSISNIGYQLMAATIATIPLFIIFLYFQKFFIKGITMGGVKG
jgi:multiple sugar transport system permease protein